MSNRSGTASGEILVWLFKWQILCHMGGVVEGVAFLGEAQAVHLTERILDVLLGKKS